MLQTFKKKLCKILCSKKKPREVVIVYPFNTKTKELLLIEEYIHHYKKSFWKFVSGGVDKNDKDLITHAREELAEEVALESENLYHVYSAPKIFGNRGTHFYVAENPITMKHPPKNPDTDEILNHKWVNQEQFQKMLDVKELLWDEATMVALQLFRKYK
ncbi:MAG: NUDIX domain-containing protein [Candidatus Pacebacteria bacterium]|nr:NUDIX domain-containing protein [Candidatus Paceibacterota bacterium]